VVSSVREKFEEMGPDIEPPLMWIRKVHSARMSEPRALTASTISTLLISLKSPRLARSRTSISSDSNGSASDSSDMSTDWWLGEVLCFLAFAIGFPLLGGVFLFRCRFSCRFGDFPFGDFPLGCLSLGSGEAFELPALLCSGPPGLSSLSSCPPFRHSFVAQRPPTESRS
jgi:hypothetical protein